MDLSNKVKWAIYSAVVVLIIIVVYFLIRKTKRMPELESEEDYDISDVPKTLNKEERKDWIKNSIEDALSKQFNSE